MTVTALAKFIERGFWGCLGLGALLVLAACVAIVVGLWRWAIG